MTSMHMARTLPASRFSGSYLGIWALVALAICIVYRPPGGLVAGALIVAAGFYELTPIKRECRRRCRERIRSGLQFSVHCFGSSARRPRRRRCHNVNHKETST